MEKMKRWTILFLMISVLLTACGNSEPVETSPGQVENIFTTPNTEATTATPEDQTDQTEGTEGNEDIQTGGMVNLTGGISHGFTDKSLIDDCGVYQIYSGGEMHTQYNISITGNLGDKGVGIMLFLDGQPQPYKTSEDGEYAYIHTMKPAAQKNTYDFYFTPVTGLEGDTLELYAMHVIYPDYYPSGSLNPQMQTGGSVLYGIRLVYEADAPVTDFSVFERVISKTIRQVDLTREELDGISEEALRTEIFYELYVNDEAQSEVNAICNVDDTLSVRFEFFGCPYVEYQLCIFIDHEPISLEPIRLTGQSGKKTVVELELDLSDFDGRGMLYAVLAARDYRPVQTMVSCFPAATGTLYLTDKATVEEMVVN